MPVLDVSISTTLFNRAYLERAWQARHELAEYERNGFSQFFYLTVTGHMEAFLSKIIETRLGFVFSVSTSLKEATFDWNSNGVKSTHPTEPIFESLRGILFNFERKIEKAPLQNLIELFQDIFCIKLSNTLGELNSDLNALANLRNIFAHGRNLWLSFEQNEENCISLDQNPLQLPAQRLFAAKILPSLRLDPSNYTNLQKAFYSDEGMLYFLNKAREIEGILKNTLSFPPEQDMPILISLPALKA
ncbi:hypothetical protein EIP75_20675 [Aquabacterium soli]|uniref:Uncharacterized protein n=1 Tax=Aquabacterium soli TaxID=2493092 RepID=A0A426V6F5_9BURK|nr:hypothetical protein [Aquabacterium soli]RRS02486.1 hypothetical protein EIP75_20675 [Aquabacterium soli]